MARTIKIDNALQKRFAKQAKKSKSRELVTYFLIVCEGEKTEPNYFKSFPKQVGKIVYDIEFDGGGIGSHTIPVHIEYIDQDGKKKVIDEVGQCASCSKEYNQTVCKYMLSFSLCDQY